MGYLGMPRRYHVYPPEFQVYHVLSTAGAMVLGVAYILPFAYLIGSLFLGAKAGINPWDAKGLEWQAPSPPPRRNFLAPPVVPKTPYDYHPKEGPAEAVEGDAA
jgi:cytochrome c oxidase subunit 1